MPIKRCVFAAFFWASLFPSIVFAETITNFKVDARLDQDRRLFVTESITYDFEDEERHGIYREIPVTYLRKGANYKLRLENISAEVDGEKTQVAITEDDGWLNIRIGDPDRTIIGRHVYSIKYETDRAINFFEGRGELYWNVTGNEWQVPIEQASFHLIGSNIAETACYTGPVGSAEAACTAVEIEGGMIFRAERLLNPSEGFTVVAGFLPGAIRPPTYGDEILMVVRDNSVLGLPIAVFLLMFYLWWTRGRDPRIGTVIPHYESPQKLTPAELAAVVEEGALPARGVTATLIDLARRGYLHIRYAEEKRMIGKSSNYTFIEKKEPEAGMADFEQAVFNSVFAGGKEVGLKDLRSPSFHDGIQHAKDLVWKAIESKRLFNRRPAMIRVGAFITGGIFAWLLIFFIGGRPLGFLSAILSGAIIALFGWFMPRRTKEGIRLLADVKGFEWFLSVTEKDRLAFHNAPERTPEQFEKFLPAAIALGVEKAWAKQFEGLDMKPPSWMEGNVAAGWAIGQFVSDIGTVNSQVTSAVHSQAGSGGSGFSGGGSGGGFGGGGGGSW